MSKNSVIGNQGLSVTSEIIYPVGNNGGSL
jgi:hypothetical protein